MAQTRPWHERALSFSERRRLKSMSARGARIANLEPDFEGLSQDELRAKTAEFRERHERGESLDSLLPEAFSAVREASRRELGMRHFDVQMIGGIALHEGSIAQMLTGEGKTLVATLPLYLNALTGRNVHLVTTNDYLAKRDAEWMGPVYRALGMNVGILQNMQANSEKQAAYSAEITYGTNSEFGFDYLRDNMAHSLEELVQRDHYFGIVDEVDSILIDEARTPLIISGQPEEAAETYYRFAKISARMEPGVHYEFDEKMHTAYPTEEGVSLAERELGIENLYLSQHNQLINHLNQAIRARALYNRDKQYVVMDGEVKIVDEHTGRIMEGRRWSEGLHQAVEAKEGVAIKEENTTVASITIQNYFRMYEKLAGMTGTAATEAAEFKEIYDLDVVEIPPNVPVSRKDENDLIFRNEDGKFRAVQRDIEERNAKGQPVLVGTIAVEKSEKLSAYLTRKGIKHEVLNAKNHEREALIVADAGQKGAVTIATNMAGRGIDIKLGEGVVEAGGLYVIGTERHESRRIDNQLRGRAGRQGDPGESRFYLSGEDDLVRIFAGDRIKNIMNRFKVEEDQPLEHKMLSKRIEGAQKKVEERNFLIRKNVLKYDDVLNTQRLVVYEQRRRVLEGHDLKEDVLDWIRGQVETAVNVHTPSAYAEEWEFDELLALMGQLYPISWGVDEIDAGTIEREDLIERLSSEALEYYEQREQQIGSEILRDVERMVFLQVLDSRWREHLDNMDYLREGIGLRGLAQKNPLSEYRAEGYEMFQELLENVKQEAVHLLMHVEVDPEAVARNSRRTADGPIGHGQDAARSDGSEARDGANGARRAGAAAAAGGSWATTGQLQYSAGGGASALDEARAQEGGAVSTQTTTVQQRRAEKVGRNEPCPCGSGKKYKHCHGTAG